MYEHACAHQWRNTSPSLLIFEAYCFLSYFKVRHFFLFLYKKKTNFISPFLSFCAILYLVVNFFLGGWGWNSILVHRRLQVTATGVSRCLPFFLLSNVILPSPTSLTCFSLFKHTFFSFLSFIYLFILRLCLCSEITFSSGGVESLTAISTEKKRKEFLNRIVISIKTVHVPLVLIATRDLILSALLSAPISNFVTENLSLACSVHFCASEWGVIWCNFRIKKNIPIYLA